jgi:hypothetical protein
LNSTIADAQTAGDMMTGDSARRESRTDPACGRIGATETLD